MRKQDTFTVCEDRPKMDRWDVEIKTFQSRAEAERYVQRKYTADERNGECELCQPRIRYDAEHEYVG